MPMQGLAPALAVFLEAGAHGWRLLPVPLSCFPLSSCSCARIVTVAVITCSIAFMRLIKFQL